MVSFYLHFEICVDVRVNVELVLFVSFGELIYHQLKYHNAVYITLQTTMSLLLTVHNRITVGVILGCAVLGEYG